jgi:N-methylhydantoinase B
MTNTLNTPVEALEQAYPFRIQSVSLRPGSGGAGQHSGGDGLTRVYAFDAPATVTLLTERRRHAPPGAAGGQPGAPGQNVRVHADGQRTTLPGKTSFDVRPGDTLELHTPGGGGHGTP